MFDEKTGNDAKKATFPEIFFGKEGKAQITGAR